MWRHWLEVHGHWLPANAMGIEHVQAEGGGTLDLGTVDALFVADAQLFTAIAKLLSQLVVSALEAAGGRGTACITCLLIQTETALLFNFISNAVLATLQRRQGGKWLLLLVIIEGDIAEFQLTTDILGILHIDTLVGTSVIALGATWAAIHHASLVAMANLLATNFLTLSELVDSSLVVAIVAWFRNALWTYA